MATGENQSRTFVRDDGVEFEIELKHVPDEDWHDQGTLSDNERDEYGLFELADSDVESDDESDDEMDD